jgi:hypothetical protein
MRLTARGKGMGLRGLLLATVLGWLFGVAFAPDYEAKDLSDLTLEELVQVPVVQTDWSPCSCS